jgi:methylthioribose-1-phosphate isomerase
MRAVFETSTIRRVEVEGVRDVAAAIAEMADSSAPSPGATASRRG